MGFSGLSMSVDIPKRRMVDLAIRKSVVRFETIEFIIEENDPIQVVSPFYPDDYTATGTVEQYIADHRASWSKVCVIRDTANRLPLGNI